MSEEFKTEATVQDKQERSEKIEADPMRRDRFIVLCHLAERIFIGLCHSNDLQDYNLASSWSLDAAEAFLAEVERRAKQCK